MLALRAIALLAPLTALALYFIRIDRPEARYKDYPYQYRYIYEHSGDVDVALIGGSRTMRVVNAPYFAELLAPGNQRPVIVYDLARSGRGMGTNFVILRDFVQQHRTRLLLVEYNDTLPEYKVHPNFFRIASWTDLFYDVSSQPGSFLSRLTTLGSHINLKIGDHLAYLGKGYQKQAAMKQATTTSDYSYPATVVSSQLTARKAAVPDWKQLPMRDWSFDSEIEHRQSFYVRQLSELAEREGAKIAFFHVPGVYAPPLSPELIKRFHETFGRRLLQPDAAVLNRLYQNGYADGSHVRKEGSDLYMQWLATQIRAEI